jgi:hypothetical protein
VKNAIAMFMWVIALGKKKEATIEASFLFLFVKLFYLGKLELQLSF